MPRRRAAALALAALGCGAATAGAVQAPGDPSVTPGGASTSATRTFSWSAVPPEGLGAVTYQGGVTTTPAPPASPGAFGAATSAAVAVPEGRLWFHVRAVESIAAAPVGVSGWTTIGPFVSDRTPPAVTATRSPGANPRGWSGVPVSVTFACTDANPGPGAWCPAPVTVGEGAGQVVTGTATDALGLTQTAGLTVAVDTTPPVPGAPAAPASGATTATARPEFTWAAGSDALSGVQYYEVIVVGRGRVASANGRTTRAVPAQNLPAGRLEWYVRTVDNANVAAVSERVTLTIDPGWVARPPEPSGVVAPDAGRPTPAAAPVAVGGRGPRAPRPASWNARALRPRAGARLTVLRPTLRWVRGPRATLLYNVQIFELRGRSVRRVVTAFPRSNRYRVRHGVLRRDRRYVWRVWPYLRSKRYAPRPVGVSYFDVGPAPAVRR